MDPDKFKRMKKAAQEQEDPVCKVFIDRGVPAIRNSDKALQRKYGDVLLTFTDGSKRSIECQATDKYTNFSYALHKPIEYVGQGLAQHAYSMLECLQERGKPEKFIIIVQAAHLHKLILMDKEKFLSKDGKFYVISPGDLTTLEGITAVGSTLEEVVDQFLSQLAGS